MPLSTLSGQLTNTSQRSSQGRATHQKDCPRKPTTATKVLRSPSASSPIIWSQRTLQSSTSIPTSEPRTTSTSSKTQIPLPTQLQSRSPTLLSAATHQSTSQQRHQRSRKRQRHQALPCVQLFRTHTRTRIEPTLEKHHNLQSPPRHPPEQN